MKNNEINNVTNIIVFLAIFKTEKYTLKVEYRPLENGAIEIVSFDIQARVIAPFQIVNHKQRRGIELSEDEQAASDMLPYTRREAK